MAPFHARPHAPSCPPLATPLRLYSPQVPFVSLRFSKGNDCELTEDILEEGDDLVTHVLQPPPKAGGGAGQGEEGEEEEDEYEDPDEAEAGPGPGAAGQQAEQQQGGRQQQGGSGSVPVIRRVSELRVMCSPDTEVGRAGLGRA